MLLLAAFLALQSGDAELERGLAALRAGDLETARVAITESIRRKPSARAYKALGVVFATAEDYQRAEPPFAEACQLDAKEEDACYYWARALYSLNRFSQSLQALDRAPRHPARPWRYSLARAEALEGLERSDDAERAYRQALTERRADPAPPSLIDPLLSYSHFLYRLGRFEDLLKSLRSAPPPYQSLPPYLYHLGRVLLQLGNASDALIPLQRAIQINPRYREAHLALSRAYFRLGETSLGKRHAMAAQ